MKKCHCPWCGAACIPAYEKAFVRRRWHGDANTCPACHREHVPKRRESLFPIVYILAVLLLCIPAVITRDALWLVPMAVGIASIPPVILLYGLPRAVLVRYENGGEQIVESQFRADLAPLSRGGRAPRILEGDVLAIRFDHPGGDPERALYPSILQDFHPEKEGIRSIGLVFLPKEDVPSRYLSVGQSFTVVRNGRPTARGTLTRALGERD